MWLSFVEMFQTTTAFRMEAILFTAKPIILTKEESHEQNPQCDFSLSMTKIAFRM
jgi:hypothetical protein